MKKFIYCIYCTLLICTCVYMIMLLDTCSVVWDMKNVSYNRVPENQIAGKAINRYNWDKEIAAGWELHDYNVHVIVPVVAHNFVDGYMWIFYSRDAVMEDERYGAFRIGGWRILSKFHIHKENGKWEILDIKEGP